MALGLKRADHVPDHFAHALRISLRASNDSVGKGARSIVPSSKHVGFGKEIAAAFRVPAKRLIHI